MIEKLCFFSTGVKSIPICGAGGVPHVDCVPHRELNDTVIPFFYSFDKIDLNTTEGVPLQKADCFATSS